MVSNKNQIKPIRNTKPNLFQPIRNTNSSNLFEIQTFFQTGIYNNTQQFKGKVCMCGACRVLPGLRNGVQTQNTKQIQNKYKTNTEQIQNKYNTNTT
jgi:hypothetical protein